MRVLQLGPYPPPEGGINRNMLAIRDELIANGHRCSIIATSKSSRITPEPDVYHPRKPTDLIKLLKTLDYDVLHVHIGGTINGRLLAFLTVCAFFGRGKSVLTLHSGGYAVEKVASANRFSRDALVFRLFRKLIGVNPLMIELFDKFGVKKDRSHLIYPFVLQNPDKAVEIPSELKKFADKHAPFLLTVCLLEDTYDLFMQIEAMEKILENAPEAGLMIVGSGELEAELKKAIAAKKYADRVLLAGDVEHQITLHLINRADILLRTTKFDGDAISVREALFLDTPVIATDNKMRPCGVHLIPVHDANALAEKVAFLAEKKPKIKAAKADDRKNIAEVVNLYKELTTQTSFVRAHEIRRQSEKKEII